MKSALLILACLLVAGCATISGPKVLTDFDSGHEITVAVGEIFDVELPSNITTGYGWNYRSECEPVVEQVGKRAYVPRSASFGMVGVGGTEIWRFRATKSGRQSLQLDYARSWEKGAAPARTVIFNVVVKV